MPSGEHLVTESPKFNKQLFKNAEPRLDDLLQGERESDESSLNSLFNERTPNLAILHEKPEHRLLLWMKAQGSSNKEIAENSGYTMSWLSQLFRQPWAQTRLLEMMNLAGSDRVSTLIKSAAEDSVMTLIELRDDPEVSDATRRSAADSLLDRYLGKPAQQVTVTQTSQITNESLDELNSRIDALTQEENRLLGRT
jgi:hypothetical protein